MSTVRTYGTATLLANGHVLVTGGDGPDGTPQATAEEFLTGTGPLVTVTPGAIPFGGQQVGSVSGVQFYKVSNVGTANLVATGAALTGRNPWDGVTMLGTVKTTASGSFATLVTIPATAMAGTHSLTAQGRRSFAAADASFTVTG